jgi:glycine/sarcosine N-methyltransferase
MKKEDTYKNIAKYYDYMLKKNPQREKFFARVFQDNGVKTVLDCACGTGNDLVMFDSLGVEITVCSPYLVRTGMNPVPT